MTAEDRIDQALDRIYRLRAVVLLLVHIALIALANQAAFWLRFDGEVPPEQRPFDRFLLPLLIAVRLAIFLPSRLHLGVWRYASIWDLRNIVIAVVGSSALFYVLVHYVLGIAVYPRSVFIIDAGILIGLMSGLRMARRIHHELSRTSAGRRLLVYGAGDAGEMIVRDILRNPGFDATPVGFVDDDPRKDGEHIHGIRVLGGRDRLAAIIARTKPEEMLIAIPSAPPHVLRNIVRSLEPYKVRISTLPRLTTLVNNVGVGQIRQLRLEDLLAREPVVLDHAPVRAVLTGKRVLVTGAGGSIGSELCRQIALAHPETLLLLDRYENTLFQVGNELAALHPQLKLNSIIADITDADRLDQVLAEFAPHVIFHAAAHKHVPLMEQNPCEAVKNNVRGTRVLAEAAARSRVERFVLISTDKAANPTSVMGAAKRVSELLVSSLNGLSATRFVVVRFGNVLGSNGSVIPTFVSQIERGGPVTVTHPEMRRYFMLIPEAVQLVLHAATINDAAAAFVLDMGEQVRVVDMARDLIRLSGYVPEQEIGIVFTGIRPGERLSEQLTGDDEVTGQTAVPKIFKVTNAVTSPDQAARLSALVSTLEKAAFEGHDDLVIEQLCRIVPTFAPSRSASPLGQA